MACHNAKKVLLWHCTLVANILVGIDGYEWNGPTVTTSSGTVHGRALPGSHNAVPVNEFLGIPFGNAKRWEAPVDYNGTYGNNGHLNASMWGPACLQVLTENTTYGSEDCLYVNVWQPADAKPDDHLPVLVFIYGGSNQFGEAEPYNMSGISAFQNAVCVNLNYRTGPIGWMAFEEDVKANKSTGSFGILDIQSALRWVQREVRHFGGDPNSVAIHGQSSGGGLAELQYVAPGSNGLFRGAISESGGLFAQSLNYSLSQTLMMAQMVGCVVNGKKVSKACMAALSPLQVTNMTYQGDWGPTVDGVTFPMDPMEALKTGHVNDVSFIYGCQTNDSNLFLFRDYTKNGNEQPNNYPNGDLVGMSASAYFSELASRVPDRLFREALKLYPVDPTSYGLRSVRNVHTLGNVESDSSNCDGRRRAALFNEVHPGRSFVYRFDYWYQSNAQCTAVPNFHLKYLGAVHQDEVTFVMNQPNFMEDGSCCGKWGLSEGQEGCARLSECTKCFNESYGEGYHAYFNDKEMKFSNLIGKYWTQFSTGNPNVATDDVPHWPSVSEGGSVVLSADISGGVEVEYGLYNDPRICEFWDLANDLKEKQQRSTMHVSLDEQKHTGF